ESENRFQFRIPAIPTVRKRKIPCTRHATKTTETESPGTRNSDECFAEQKEKTFPPCSCVFRLRLPRTLVDRGKMPGSTLCDSSSKSREIPAAPRESKAPVKVSINGAWDQ